ncbi:MAG TPA: hypothetical protein VIJ92_12435 [Ginsengibacter sp.]
MNQYAILQSNLLDIIFENRNKEYGAYTLRKSYNGRMRIALLSMTSLSLLLCLLFLNKSTPISNVRQNVSSILSPKTFDYRPPSKPQHKVAVTSIHLKKINLIDLVPKIVDSININKLPATPIETTQSLNSRGISEINYPTGEKEGGVDSNVGVETATPLAQSKINKPGPVNIAEIMPQYPGGLKALVDFLKKNLHAPEDVEGDEYQLK